MDLDYESQQAYGNKRKKGKFQYNFLELYNHTFIKDSSHCMKNVQK